MGWLFKTTEQKIAVLESKIKAFEELKKGSSPEKAAGIDKKIEKLNHKVMHLQRKQTPKLKKD